ncbi:MAG TPA: aa3-type cytochrome c oxidase subunit IV [Caulobacteraceae bacterium]|jgi:high-affinity Fe2+/Pb2+ permease
MAANEYHEGDQDISQNKAMYLAFLGVSKWSSLVLAAGLIALVIWFCTPLGFVTGAIWGVVVLVVGYMLLRKRPAKAAAH